MQYIDEKFKDDSPENTVERIKKILSDIGIELHEKWTDSGIENCCSLSVFYNNNYPSTNGKGITPAFARASGYAEFMERLQCGLFSFAKENDSTMDLDSYAPDKKYMTKKELVENGEWMDYVIHEYGTSLTREKIADQCAMYAFSDDKILTVPFYSLFEDKYVYLPSRYIRYMFTANGLCAGNSKEEAWIHAFSEMLERHNGIEILCSGKPVHVISEDVLNSFPVVSKILETIKKCEFLDVKVLDFSLGMDFPVIATRIINKKTHDYRVNVGADPILEIAIERTLTEIFQGGDIENFHSKHGGKVFSSAEEASTAKNIANQTTVSSGIYTTEFFNDLPSEEHLHFSDNANKSNPELLKGVLNIFKKMGRPVYIRNYSYLGFDSYRICVPGFSETKSKNLTMPVQEFYFSSKAKDTLRNIEKASDEELSELFIYYSFISGIHAVCNNFSRLSGIQMTKYPSVYMLNIHLAYAAYRLKDYDRLRAYLGSAEEACADLFDKEYINCLLRYFDMRHSKNSKEATVNFLEMLYSEKVVKRLKENLNERNLFKGMLLSCSYPNCGDCKIKQSCRHQDVRDIMKKTGEIYSKFTDGQNKENFKVDF